MKKVTFSEKQFRDYCKMTLSENRKNDYVKRLINEEMNNILKDYNSVDEIVINWAKSNFTNKNGEVKIPLSKAEDYNNNYAIFKMGDDYEVSIEYDIDGTYEPGRYYPGDYGTPPCSDVGKWNSKFKISKAYVSIYENGEYYDDFDISERTNKFLEKALYIDDESDACEYFQEIPEMERLRSYWQNNNDE